MKSLALMMIIFAFLTINCANEEEIQETRISGFYEIVSFVSSVAVDMNNDGIKSKDIYSEITSPHRDLNGERFTMYNSGPGKYMEVRPNQFNNVEAKIISLNVPDQLISEFSPGVFYLSEYFLSFQLFTYQVNEISRKIDLVKINPDFAENGTIKNFELLADGSLKLDMTKKLFDFKDAKWIEADITIIYKKVND